ncbi:MAG: hypothetical protein Q7Q71_01395 [Verrucomicrobiota bacterium JB023]|nr:hypothetical protein [Verrucomicrobiota bacterium JB023]
MAKTSTKGKRYTTEEKQKVLDYVAQVDAEKGRGGVAAASREFGITPLTIAAWKKKLGGGSAPAASKNGKAPRGATSQARVLHRLAEILDEIAAKQADIDALEKEYSKLKKKV